jgi:hypothetical protein
MKGVFKQGVCLALILQTTLYAPFSGDVAFNVMLPKEFRWGVFHAKEDVVALSKTCLAGDLADASINNNSGKAGDYTGTTVAFQLCPCLVNGVSYWNPLALAKQYSPCSLVHFSPVGNSYSGDCGGSEVALATGGSGSEVTTVNATGSPNQQKLLQGLSTKLSYAPTTINKDYKSLYDTIHEEATFLIEMSQMLTPNATKGQGFLSVPYLRFCASYGESFVTQASLEDSEKDIFGDNIDTSTYFPDNQFMVVIDLDELKSVKGDDKVRRRQTGSTTSGGALIRAQEQGYIKTTSAKSLLATMGGVLPKQGQSLISKFATASGTLANYPNIIGERALLEELFFLHLAMMQPIPVATGMYNPSEPTISTALASSNVNINSSDNIGVKSLINRTPFTFYPQQVAAKKQLSELYAKLFPMARYVRGLNINSEGKRPSYAPQPIDTFYGAIIVNNGTFHGQPVSVSVPPFGNPYEKGQVGIFPVNGGVDRWPVAGINPLSGLKYRSISLQTSASSGALFMSGNMELQIEEGSGGSVYQSGLQKIFPPGVALFDKVNNVRTTLNQSETIRQFFTLTPSTPWAVVIEVANAKGIGGTPNPQPTFTILGLARLNPNMFPLTYTAGDMSDIAMTPFTQSALFAARQRVFDNLDTMHGTKIDTDVTVVRNGNTTKLGHVQTPEVNMNLVKFNGALSYGWGAKTSIGDALKTVENLMNSSFLTIDTSKPQGQQIIPATILDLVKKADQNPDPKGIIVPVASKTFELFSVTAEKSL